MKIEKELLEEICSKKNEGLTIVSICGAADLGKSHISKQLKSSLNQQKIITSHLTLDSYLMDRTMRNKKETSGYEIEAYSLKKVSNDLLKLKKCQPIEYRPYDHKSGRRSNEIVKRIDSKSDIVIFDGLHGMHPLFMNHIDISIFVYTTDELLIKIRKEADLSKRGYTKQYSNEISKKEFNLYKKNIEPYKGKANYLLFMKSKWEYKLYNNHIRY